MSTEFTKEHYTENGTSMVDSYSLKLVFAARHLHESIASYLSSSLQAKGYTGATESNLNFLGTLECGVNYGSDIARSLGVSRQMVAKSVKELSKLGYLEQLEGEGKQKPIIFTPRGEMLMSEARQFLAQLDETIEDQIGGLQMKAMINLLEKLNHSLGQ